MKWDYWTYLRQPTWFIDVLTMKSKVDAENAEIELKRRQRGNN